MLANAGKVSAELAKEHAEREFTEYRRQRGQQIIDILEAEIEAAFPFFDKMTGTKFFTGKVYETGGLDKMSLQLSAPQNDSRLRS